MWARSLRAARGTSRCLIADTQCVPRLKAQNLWSAAPDRIKIVEDENQLVIAQRFGVWLSPDTPTDSAANVDRGGHTRAELYTRTIAPRSTRCRQSLDCAPSRLSAGGLCVSAEGLDRQLARRKSSEHDP